MTWFATLDGALGHLLPVAEKTYRRLTMLMNVMTTNLPHTAGLNPKGFRQMRQGRKDLRNASRGIVDGDLVFKYPDLPAPEKVPTIIASKITPRFHNCRRSWPGKLEPPSPSFLMICQSWTGMPATSSSTDSTKDCTRHRVLTLSDQ